MIMVLLLQGLLQFNMEGKVEYGIKIEVNDQIITGHPHKEIRQVGNRVHFKAMDGTMPPGRVIIHLDNMEGVMRLLVLEILFRGMALDKENNQTMHNQQ